MESTKWKKLENEDGYPCYINETTGKEQYDHPKYLEIIEKLKVHDGIKYGAYRIAFKIYELQKQLKVPALRISSGVFGRHQLSLSESSLSLDTAELEAVLADIYFAAEKEGQFSGDIDLAVDLMINLLLNVYDRDRKEPIRVLACKTLLIVLSEQSAGEKWSALAGCAADHNGCVSPRRLAALLRHVASLEHYLGGGAAPDLLQEDVDACFQKSAGMLGLPARAVAAWGAGSRSARWLPVLQRVAASRRATLPADTCSACAAPLLQMLRFECAKCRGVRLCEACHLQGRGAREGHSASHLVHEIIDGSKRAPRGSFMKGVRRLFQCSKRRKRRGAGGAGGAPRPPPRPAIATSTVRARAAPPRAPAPAALLRDVITHLETHYNALRELSAGAELSAAAGGARDAETHWTHIAAQIDRLKAFQETLSNQTEPPAETYPEKAERPQAFDLFSPIPVVAKQSKVSSSPAQASPPTQASPTRAPRVLSLDSGRFSSSPRSPHVLSLSGDALRPARASPSLSALSMRDISSWYNEQESLASAKPQGEPSPLPPAPAPPAPPAPRAPPDLDAVLDRLQQLLAHNFAMDDSCFDNSQLRETASEMEGLLGSLIRGVERRAAAPPL